MNDCAQKLTILSEFICATEKKMVKFIKKKMKIFIFGLFVALKDPAVIKQQLCQRILHVKWYRMQ